MTLYCIKQFNLYYAGMISGNITFTNNKLSAIALSSLEAAEDKCKEIGDGCEIEERVL